MSKILLIEDDVGLCQSIIDALKREYHVVEPVHDGAEGLSRLRFYACDLCIVDWNLPGLTGVEICREYRTGGGTVPILMLTGKDQPEDVEAGLDAGADDYLTKPFDAKVLAARVRALLRRPQQYVAQDLRFANIMLKGGTLVLEVAGQEEALLPREAALLMLFLKHPDQILASSTILDAVWPSESDSGVDALRTCIKRLRRKIEVEGSGCAIRTVYGVGYQLSRS